MRALVDRRRRRSAVVLVVALAVAVALTVVAVRHGGRSTAIPLACVAATCAWFAATAFAQASAGPRGFGHPAPAWTGSAVWVGSAPTPVGAAMFWATVILAALAFGVPGGAAFLVLVGAVWLGLMAFAGWAWRRRDGLVLELTPSGLVQRSGGASSVLLWDAATVAPDARTPLAVVFTSLRSGGSFPLSTLGSALTLWEWVAVVDHLRRYPAARATLATPEALRLIDQIIDWPVTPTGWGSVRWLRPPPPADW